MAHRWHSIYESFLLIARRQIKIPMTIRRIGRTAVFCFITKKTITNEYSLSRRWFRKGVQSPCSITLWQI